ncbi:MAG: 3-isopropylmalate dehydratase small subunit [Desulfovibrio sp.]
MDREFTGKVWKLREDVDTDIIIATQYLAISDMQEMKKYAFEPLRPELAALIEPGDIIVAGKNFGCGSSREQAPEVMVALGIRCVIAPSFARIFFRNAINNGLLLIENNDLYDECGEGDRVTVKINKCLMHNGKEYPIPQMPDDLFAILDDGGLVKSMKKRNGLTG